MKTAAWVIVIVLILLVGTGIYFLTQGNNKTTGNLVTNPYPNPNPSPTPSPTPTPTPTPNPTPSPTYTPVDLMGNIANNHGHTVVITAAQQEAGKAVTLELTPGSGHTHTLSLTATQVQTIAKGMTVEETSSVNAGHSHLVTFN